MFTRSMLLAVITVAHLFTISTLRAEDEIIITTIPVADNIYMLTGKGGNIGVFTGDDGTFVIDDQFAPMTSKILASIKSVGGETPRFLLNTHFHGDHTGGNENLGRKGALIVAHNNVRQRLVSGSFIKAFGMKTKPANKVALPEVTFSKELTFHINDELVKAIHVAQAHTDGDSYIHFQKANVIHAGDIFFNGFYPYIDAAHGGSVKGMIQGVDEILALTDANSKIIPGHGPLSDRTQLQAYRDMLDTAYNRLLTLKNQGISAQDAIKQGPLDDLEEKWGKGIFTGQRWIDIIYPAIF